jgi:hypothetical protein
MANRLLKQFSGTLTQGVVKLYGHVVTSTSGTVGSYTAKGFTVAKTGSEAGRYTVTLSDTYCAFLGCQVTLVGAADAAYTTAKGIVPFVRNVSVADSTPTFDIQFADADGSAADAELADAAEFYVEITLKNSSV